MTIPALKLTSGDAPPSVGLGLWKIDPEAVSEVVLQAAKLGYRHFDSASDYGNEAEVGTGIRQILDDAVCRRDELWVTSKLWNTDHAREHVRSAALRSLADLGLDYLDLTRMALPLVTKGFRTPSAAPRYSSRSSDVRRRDHHDASAGLGLAT